MALPSPIPVIKSLDIQLVEIANRGLRVANLFQYQLPGTDLWRWQSNLTDGQQAWEFGRGDTPQAALQAALIAITTTEARPLRPQASPQASIQIIDRRPTPAPMSDEEAAKIDF